MTPQEALERLLVSYRPYYNVKTEDVMAPFAAEAEFHLTEEQYFLFKSAKMNATETHEYVFFYVGSSLSPAEAQQLEAAAWEEGMKRVQPHEGHKSSDIILYLFVDTIEPDAGKFLRHIHRYQSYKHSFWGWSHYRVIAQELSTGRLFCNRMGRDLRKFFRNKKSKKK